MKYNFDIAAEMIKIAESAEHQKSMEKLAFSREGKEEVSEVEEEMKKLASEDCDCKEGCEDCDCDCHDKSEKKASLEETAGLLLEISSDLEDQGQERLAAATILLADSMLKTAAAKKKPADKKKPGSSPSSSSGSSSSSSSGKDKKPGKKMSLKERMKKMRDAQGKKGKGKKEDKSKKK